MLRGRLLVSAILIPLLAGLLYVDALAGPAAPVLLLICLFVGLRCSWELHLLLRPAVASLPFATVGICTAVLLLSVWVSRWQIGAALDAQVDMSTTANMFVGCFLLLFLVRVVRYRAAGGHLRILAAELFNVSYVGLLLSVTAQLRWLGPDGNGYLALGSVIAATKMGDVGAYTLGRLFGRRKMAPYLSPGKTWMGGLGAVLGGVLGAVFWLRIAAPLFQVQWRPEYWIWAPAYGVVMAIAGSVGDLCESLIKRDVGAKDSAALFPGFGGLLDLLDSILFAGPVAVVLWQVFLRSHSL